MNHAAMNRRAFLSGVFGAAAAATTPARAAAVDDAPVRAWIDRARTLKSVAAELRQERHLRALNRPLVSPGRLWYRADGALRWQLGEPPKTIALRPAAGTAVTVIEPDAKTVRSFTTETAGLKGGALALLDAGFPESFDAFEKRFRLDRVERTPADTWHITTQLRDSPLTIAVMKMVFVVNTPSHQLQGLEIWLRDGSKIVNHFDTITENAPVPDSLFHIATDGYREIK